MNTSIYSGWINLVYIHFKNQLREILLSNQVTNYRISTKNQQSIIQVEPNYTVNQTPLSQENCMHYEAAENRDPKLSKIVSTDSRPTHRPTHYKS